MKRNGYFCRMCGDYVGAGMKHSNEYHADPRYTGAMNINEAKNNKQFVVDIDPFGDRTQDARLSAIAAASGYAPLTKERK